MTKRYDPDRHHRRSIRHPDWDYRSAGAYFITICTHKREYLFADPGCLAIAEDAWRVIPDHPHARHVSLDAWVIMPNHLHGVLVLEDPDGGIGRESRRCPPGSLGAIVGNYKALVTRRVNDLRATPGAAVWQRNYYERIVRNQREMDAIRRYIADNPARWEADRDNLDRLLARMSPGRR